MADEKKPGFFKRLFGFGKAAEPVPEAAPPPPPPAPEAPPLVDDAAERIAREIAEAKAAAQAAEDAAQREAQAKAEAEQRALEEASRKAEAKRLAAEDKARLAAEAGAAAEQREREAEDARRKAEEDAARRKAEGEAKAAEERAQRDRAEAARIAAEKAAADKAEAAKAGRVAAEKAAVELAERQRAEAAERERLEAQRKAEEARLASEREARERAEAERAAAEKAAADKAETGRLAAEKAAAELADRQRAEAERLAAGKAEADRLAAESAAAERTAAERAEADRLATERAEAARLEAARLETARLETARLETARLETARLEAEREKEEADRRAAEAAAAAAAPAPKLSWWQKLKSGLSRTASNVSEGITGLFTKRKLDDETLEELEDLLIQADLGIDVAARISAAVGKGRYDKEIEPDEVKAILAEEVAKVLAPVAKPLVLDAVRKPFVLLMVGVNGSGKTTTIGKLASKFRAEGRKVMLAAGDTFRAAAIEQLKIWGERTGAPVIARDQGGDAAGLAFDAFKAAQEQGVDVLLIDTAGRLQNRTELMAELEKVIRVIRKLDETAPHATLLVLDATVGQNALSQVEIFGKQAGVTGLVMTKLDGTARGGILVAIAEKFKMPIHFIGVGEQVDDLEPFEAKDFARAIAGLEKLA